MRVAGSSPRSLVERGQLPLMQNYRLSPVDASGIRFSYYYFRQRVLECSEPHAQAAGHILHVQNSGATEDFFDLVDLLLCH